MTIGAQGTATQILAPDAAGLARAAHLLREGALVEAVAMGGNGMRFSKYSLELLHRPILPIGVDSTPCESCISRLRIAEVVDFVFGVA